MSKDNYDDLKDEKGHVEEPEHSDLDWECPRCQKFQCGDCIVGWEVDFDIYEERMFFDKNVLRNFHGLRVCPWCYNQLVDLKKEESKK